jgi:hypothetical protein
MQPAIMEPRMKPLPQLSDFEYHTAEPFGSQVTINCPSCKAKHRVATTVFSGTLSLRDKERLPKVAYTGQTYRVLSKGDQILLKILLFVVVAIVGRPIASALGGGDIAVEIAWIVGSLVGGFVIGWVVAPLVLRFFGRSFPICLLSCPRCRARIPITTDGKIFKVADKAIAPQEEDKGKPIEKRKE